MNNGASLLDEEKQQGGGNALETLNRSIHVLHAFSGQESELSLTDLHKKLGLSKSSLQRILHTLVLHGFLEKNTRKKTYHLGLALHFLGNQAGHHPLLQAARPVMKSLSEQTGACISLNIAIGKKRKCAAVEADAQQLSEIDHTGQETLLHAGASGKLLLAYSAPRQIEAYLHAHEELEALTKDTMTDKGALLLDLCATRGRGYAESSGERVPGVYCVSAPIFNEDRQVAAGISIALPKLALDDSSINHIDLITGAAEQVTERLVAIEKGK